MNESKYDKTKFETPGAYIEYLQIIGQECVSLNEFVGNRNGEGECENELGDIIMDTSPTIEEVIEIKDIRERLMSLINTVCSPREAFVVRLRYGFEDNVYNRLERIAERFNLSRERIRQVEQKALRKIKAELTRLNIKCEGDL